MRKFIRIGLGVCLVALTNVLAGDETVIKWGGIVMIPTIPQNSTITISKKISSLKRGDLILFKRTREPGRVRTSGSRLIALGGDSISMKKGIITLNGQKLNENHIIDYWRSQQYQSWDTDSFQANSITWLKDNKCVWKAEICTLPKNTIFVIGDNRSLGGSEDSRAFGPVDTSAIEAQIIAVNNVPVVRPKVFDTIK
jgi:signal peptidase I